jgi:catalase
MPSCTFDAVVIPDGSDSAAALSELGQAVEFVKDQYRHCKTILAVGAGRMLLERAMIPEGKDDPGLLVVGEGQADRAFKPFTAAVTLHRHWDRATDPPLV